MIASGGEVRVGDESLAELKRLEAVELRLLAEAIGEHLLVGLAERVDLLRAERRAVACGPPAR